MSDSVSEFHNHLERCEVCIGPARMCAAGSTLLREAAEAIWSGPIPPFTDRPPSSRDMKTAELIVLTSSRAEVELSAPPPTQTPSVFDRFDRFKPSG